MTKTYRVRPMTAADLAGAEELFKASYDRAAMGLEHRRWFITDSHLSPRIGCVAEAADGRIVGHVSYVPVPFRREGRPTLGAFMIQAMIHPDFQKQGIFKALVAACEVEHDRRGVEVLQAFPNDNSIHAFIAHFGWRELVGPNYIYFRILDPAGVARSKVHSEVLARAAALTGPLFHARLQPDVRRVDSLDERVDDLWRKFSRVVPSGIDRTRDYLRWRMAPLASSYVTYVVERGESLDGLLVTKCEERFGLRVGYVVELLFDPERPAAGRRLLTHAAHVLRAEGASVALAATAGSSPVRRALYCTGFWHLPRRLMPHGIHFVYRFRDTERARPNEYFVSWLDHDLI